MTAGNCMFCLVSHMQMHGCSHACTFKTPYKVRLLLQHMLARVSAWSARGKVAASSTSTLMYCFATRLSSPAPSSVTINCVGAGAQGALKKDRDPTQCSGPGHSPAAGHELLGRDPDHTPGRQGEELVQAEAQDGHGQDTAPGCRGVRAAAAVWGAVPS